MRKLLLFAIVVMVLVQNFQVSRILHRLRALPAPAVYQLSTTAAGELGVYCANGADATIRPADEFGHITVSCGK
jgi:hypothetical protein